MSREDEISIQISLYPLGETDITEEIFRLLDVFNSHGLEYNLGSMSTVISGKTSVVFQALEEAYRQSARHGKFVLVCTMSNAVPTEKALEGLNTEQH